MTYSKQPNWTLALGLPLLVALVCTVICFSPLFTLHPDRLSTGITLDLVLTAPLLYLWAIHKSTVSKMTVIRVFIVGLLVAGLLLHNRTHPLLTGIKTWISPMVEGWVLFLIGRKIYQARKKEVVPVAGEDFLIRCRRVAGKVLGNEKLGGIITGEIGTFYYLVAGRRSKEGFSYAKASGAIPVLGAFILCMLAEGTGLHFLLAHWSTRLAWILTGLSAYTLLQLYAHMRAMHARPISVSGGFLHLRNGLAGEVSIPIAAIEELTTISRPIRGEKAVQLALFRVLESSNMRLKLRQPVTIIGMFGIRKPAEVILFAVDQPTALLAAVQQADRA